ncbi:hypothetical protein [Streptomyces odontomachi]|uniref:hypothetical protein n=1 Tax=Streptomyces odontomachi TaxID=2944940 RepID=UPI002109B774|nr:hypothetical protein [Streptomyces sp. ODS25]
MTSPIDDLLARARLNYEPCTRDEIDAARARLIARLARAPENLPLSVLPEETSLTGGETSSTGGAWEAARDLRTLCETVVTRTALHSLLDFFTHTVMPQPVGARVLGCLLQLADSEESARFWWQYAAGADDAPAAFCLYLHHLALGEIGEADWWYAQGVMIQARPADVLPPCRACVRAGCAPLAEVVEEYAPALPLEQAEPADALRTSDASLPTTLRVLRALKTRNGSAPVPTAATAIMDYVPAALGYVDDDLDLPLPAPDFADHIRTLTAYASPPAAAPRPRSPRLPARNVRCCGRRRHTARHP